MIRNKRQSLKPKEFSKEALETKKKKQFQKIKHIYQFETPKKVPSEEFQHIP